MRCSETAPILLTDFYYSSQADGQSTGLESALERVVHRLLEAMSLKVVRVCSSLDASNDGAQSCPADDATADD